MFDKLQNYQQNNKRIAKNTLMLYFRMVLLMVVNLYTSRVVLNALGAEDFGLYSVVGSVVVFLGFLNSSMAGASQRFLSYAKGKGNKEENIVFNSLCITHLIIALVIVIFAETLGIFYINTYLNVSASRIIAAHVIFQLSLGCLLCKTITVPYNAAIISNEKMDAFALISILEGLLQLAVAILLPLFFTDKLIIYGSLMFCVVFITQLCYRIYSHRHFAECRFRKNWDRIRIHQIFVYSGWNLFGSLSAVAISQGLNMVLNFYFGVIVNAARGIASQVNGALASFTNNFQQSLNPQIVKTYAAKDYKQMHKYIIKGARLSFFLLLVLAVPFIFNIQEVLRLWLVNVPEYTAWLCRLELVYALICTLSSTLLIGVMATNDIKKYQIVVASTNLLTLPLAIIALQIYKNPYIASVIMCVVALLACYARLAIASKQIFISKRTYISNLAKAIIPSLVIILPVEYYLMTLLPEGGLFLLIIRMGISFLICVAVVWLLGISSSERSMITSFTRKRLHI